MTSVSSTWTRRGLLAGIALVPTAATVGCLGDDTLARRASFGRGIDETTERHLLDVAPLRGEEQLALGILVDEDAPRDPDVAAAVVRDREGDVLADVPLRNDRDVSRLADELHSLDESLLDDGDGERYAVILGPPPQHGVVEVHVVAPDGEVLDGLAFECNCYADEGHLP